MKKLLSIFILLVYGLSSTGMTLHAHFCCGELEKVDFQSSVCSKECPASPEINGKSCCDEKQVDLNLKSEYNTAKFIQSPVTGDLIRQHHSLAIVPRPVASLTFLPEIFAPPPLKKDLLVLFSTYRI